MWQLVPAAAANEDILIITSVPDVNVTLNCAAKIKPGLQYHAVRWYKVKQDFFPRLSGLVSKTLPDGQMMWYVDADTRVSLEEGTLNLRLPTVTCSDQAVYQCYLAAPVGEQNRKGRVRLSVTESTPLEPQRLMTRENLILCGAVGLLLSALMLFLFSCVSSTPSLNNNDDDDALVFQSAFPVALQYNLHQPSLTTFIGNVGDVLLKESITVFAAAAPL
uniref:Ig-like domain-containing protein n=1 Tax=Periophthalmus magnuspinnatus TaxID=409849 RepID=A0A3B4B942_9GOBI